MLHRFGFAGGSVSYRNRFLQSNSYREASAKGALARGEFATDPCRTLLGRVAAIFGVKCTGFRWHAMCTRHYTNGTRPSGCVGFETLKVCCVD